ncbi:hypothetical protein [Tateyamaria sp.]
MGGRLTNESPAQTTQRNLAALAKPLPNRTTAAQLQARLADL